MIEPLPSQERYQNCSLRMDRKNKKDWEKVVMMGDPQHLALLKADFTDKMNIKGRLVFKCDYRSIVDVQLDPKDKKTLTLFIMRDKYEYCSERQECRSPSKATPGVGHMDFTLSQDSNNKGPSGTDTIAEI